MGVGVLEDSPAAERRRHRFVPPLAHPAVQPQQSARGAASGGAAQGAVGGGGTCRRKLAMTASRWVGVTCSSSRPVLAYSCSRDYPQGLQMEAVRTHLQQQAV